MCVQVEEAARSRWLYPPRPPTAPRSHSSRFHDTCVNPFATIHDQRTREQSRRRREPKPALLCFFSFHRTIRPACDLHHRRGRAQRAGEARKRGVGGGWATSSAVPSAAAAMPVIAILLAHSLRRALWLQFLLFFFVLENGGIAFKHSHTRNKTGRGGERQNSRLETSTFEVLL